MQAFAQRGYDWLSRFLLEDSEKLALGATETDSVRDTEPAVTEVRGL